MLLHLQYALRTISRDFKCERHYKYAFSGAYTSDSVVSKSFSIATYMTTP
jgi:hypothetical protein